MASILPNSVISEIANNKANTLAPACCARKSQTWFENYTRKAATRSWYRKRSKGKSGWGYVYAIN